MRCSRPRGTSRYFIDRIWKIPEGYKPPRGMQAKRDANGWLRREAAQPPQRELANNTIARVPVPDAPARGPPEPPK